MPLYKHPAALRALAALVLLCCFTAMYFFTAPELDVFLFAQTYDPDVGSILSGAFGYGNGRFLGNVLGFFFSQRFAWAFALMALCMTGIVWTLNRVFFRGSVRTLFPLALLAAFPSMKMTQDVYGVFAAFVNYACPVFLLLLSAALLLRLRQGKARGVRYAALLLILFVSAASSALFSENTTIVLLTFAVLWIVEEKMHTHKISAPSVVHLLGAAVGALVMLLLPVLSHSTHKLDDYRGTFFTTVPSLLRGGIGGVMRTCSVVDTFFVPITLVCVGLFLSMRHMPPSRSVRFARAVFAVYPLLSLLLTLTDLLLPFSRSTQILHVPPAFCLAAAVCIAILREDDRTEKRRGVLFAVLFLSSVVPMLCIMQYGFRTYYITFFVLTAWGLYLLRRHRVFLREKMQAAQLWAKLPAAACCCVFVLMAGVYTVQSAINFDVYAIRTEQIEHALRQGDTQITVPILPCRYISGEELWPHTVSMALPEETDLQIDLTADMSRCDDAARYRAVYGKAPVHALRLAVRNLSYKDPLLLYRDFAD